MLTVENLYPKGSNQYWKKSNFSKVSSLPNLPPQMTKAMTAEKFDQVDQDGSGTIEWSEFKDAMLCICGSWRASFIRDMTHSYTTWLIYKRCDSYNRMEWFQRRDDTHLRYVTCLIHMRHDSFIWDMTHLHETWLIHMRHDSFVRDMTRFFVWDRTHSYATWLIHMRHDGFRPIHTWYKSYKQMESLQRRDEMSSRSVTICMFWSYLYENIVSFIGLFCKWDL